MPSYLNNNLDAEDPLKEFYRFSPSEWNGLLLSGAISAGISFICNLMVLLLHFFLMWYRPYVVNRVSLRMIVAACICNTVFCAIQLVSDDTKGSSQRCSSMAYILAAFDTMSCICLAMVGLNLVLIFAVKIPRSYKIELLYFAIVLMSGIIVCIVPLVVPSSKGFEEEDPQETCWYRYYFYGRIHNIFNWVWYYSWLLFASLFAAICAAISIFFVGKKQENFAITLDVFTTRNRSKPITTNAIRKISTRNSEIFLKIARRCICYPLVPLLSKSWGVGIEVAAARGLYIPYAIFLIDRVFSCLLGFMVSCIYFTDPAILAEVKDSIANMKEKYVYNYYSVRYQPGINFDNKSPKPQFLQVLKVVPIPETFQFTPNLTGERHNGQFEEDEIDLTDINRNKHASLQNPTTYFSRMPIDPFSTASSRFHTAKDHLPAIQVTKACRKSTNEIEERRYSIISATSVGGHRFIPKQTMLDTKGVSLENKSTFSKLFQHFQKNDKRKIIPMRRSGDTLGVDVRESQYRNNSSPYQGHTDAIETLIPFENPAITKAIHWILVCLFRASPLKDEMSSSGSDPYDFEAVSSNPKRHKKVTSDFTVGSNKNSSTLGDLSTRTSGLRRMESFSSISFTTVSPATRNSSLAVPSSNGHHTHSPSGSVPDQKRLTMANNSSSFRTAQKLPNIPTQSESIRFAKKPVSSNPILRRRSSVNVASLQRNRLRNREYLPSVLPSRSEYEGESPEDSSHALRFASSIGLTKMIKRGRSMSISLAKFPYSRRTNLSQQSFQNEHQNTLARSSESRDNDSIEMQQYMFPKTQDQKPTSTNAYESDTIDKSNSAAIGEENSRTQMMVLDGAEQSEKLSTLFSSYPKELSPRPRSQYEKKKFSFSIERDLQEHQHQHQQLYYSLSLDTIPKDTLRSAPRSTPRNSAHFSNDSTSPKSQKCLFTRSSVDSSIGIKEMLYGNDAFADKGSFEVNSLSSDSVHSHKDSLDTMSAKRESASDNSEGYVYAEELDDVLIHEGFKHGKTSAQFISNWQDETSEGFHDNTDHRISVVEEPWDLEEQLQKQIEFADNITYL